MSMIGLSTAILNRLAPKQRDYPKEIIVGDAIYKIRFVRKINETAGKHTEVVGLCDPSEREILLLQGLSPGERFQSFIHEILHAIEYEHEIKLPHSLVYKLEYPLAQLILENLWPTAVLKDVNPIKSNT